MIQLKSRCHRVSNYWEFESLGKYRGSKWWCFDPPTATSLVNQNIEVNDRPHNLEIIKVVGSPSSVLALTVVLTIVAPPTIRTLLLALKQ